MLQEYDGFSDVNGYRLNKIPLWARVKGLPDGLTRRRELAEKVAAKVGDPPFTVVVNEGRINPASTLRTRVFVDVNEPLVRFVPIKLKEHKKFSVFYSKNVEECFLQTYASIRCFFCSSLVCGNASRFSLHVRDFYVALLNPYNSILLLIYNFTLYNNYLSRL